MIWETFPLLKFEIIALFVNTWTADYKYPVVDCENLQFSLKCNYLKNKKLFLIFLCHLWNLHQILNTVKKKMVVRANVFWKLQNVKDLFRLLIQKRCFRTSFDSQHVKESQTLVKSSWEYFYHIFPSPWHEMIREIFLLLKFEMIALLLTHGLPITSILFRIVIISRSLFKCNYLKKEDHFVVFRFMYGIYIKFWTFKEQRRST